MFKKIMRFFAPLCCFFALLLVQTQALVAQTITVPDGIQAALNRKNHASLVVWHSQDAQPVIRFQADTPYTPASVMKVLTSATALENLGANHRWQTRWYAQQSIKNRTLSGDVWIVSDGDPKMVPELWQESLQKLRQQVDVFKDVRWHLISRLAAKPDTAIDDPDAIYSTQPHAFTMSFNVLSLAIDDKIQAMTPLYGVEVIDRLQRDDLNACPPGKGYAAQLRPKVEKTPQGARVYVDGRYTLSCGKKWLHVPLFAHQEFFMRAILGIWQNLGGRTENSFNFDLNYSLYTPPYPMIFQHESLPLRDVLLDMNKFSNNLMARLVFLSLGDQQNLSQQQGSIKNAQATLASWGVRATLENGSGLSYQERVSAYDIAKVLKVAQSRPWFMFLRDSLPKVGVDGTMQSRLRNFPIQAWIKTGTLRNTRAIAGYVQSKTGGYWLVVSVIGDENVGGAMQTHDDILRWLSTL